METTRLALRVVPRARRSEVAGRHGDAWKIRVASVPDRGRANHELVSYLAGLLGVVVSDVRIVSGHTARDKIVEVAGVGLTEMEARLDSAMRKDA